MSAPFIKRETPMEIREENQDVVRNRGIDAQISTPRDAYTEEGTEHPSPLGLGVHMSRDVRQMLKEEIARCRDAVTGLEMRFALSGPALHGIDLDGAQVMGDEEPDFAVLDEAAACGAIPNDYAPEAIADEEDRQRTFDFSHELDETYREEGVSR